MGASPTPPGGKVVTGRQSEEFWGGSTQSHHGRAAASLPRYLGEPTATHTAHPNTRLIGLPRLRPLEPPSAPPSPTAPSRTQGSGRLPGRPPGLPGRPPAGASVSLLASRVCVRKIGGPGFHGPGLRLTSRTYRWNRQGVSRGGRARRRKHAKAPWISTQSAEGPAQAPLRAPQVHKSAEGPP